MKLGDLKINCYKLIDPSDEQVIASNIMTVYETDTAYSFYFLNMLNSINQAITRITQACILPLKRLEIDCKEEYEKALKPCLDKDNNPILNADGTEKKYLPKKRLSINLAEKADDIYKVKLIEYEDKNGNGNRLYYRTIGNYLDVALMMEGAIVVYYYPRIKSVEWYYQNQKSVEDINDLELSVLGLNDSLLSIIPYFVKADLLEHDKPTEAILARNVFEQYLSSFESPDIEIHNKQKSWWSDMV
ncbi:MAG TPA: hypothetical protein PKV66_01645 [Candidatus Pelethenecus sp.]|nr:hypothetical protein [Candidatus Pelethenecus sp.]